MPIPTPFHPRTSKLCTSYSWKEWAGYHAVCSYDVHHDREYTAFRHSAGLLDATPLFKYDITGPDAGRFLSYVTVKDATRIRNGRVVYLCWTDTAGKVLDDGTLTRWDDHHYRLTSADPSYSWLSRNAHSFDVEVVDVTPTMGTLALQGPRSRAILDACCDAAPGDTPVQHLKFFGATHATMAGKRIEVTRTGYTGDLGYEVWMQSEDALAVWDTLMEAGAPHGITPAGLNALDVSRVEAGFILGGVDYTSARRALIEDQKSSPIEIGLGWTVQLDREPFIGQRHLLQERRTGAKWAIAGLVIDWEELEELYDSFGLPPNLPMHAWRESIPLYEGVQQVGYATSGAWSPTLKKNLAIATLPQAYAKEGTRLSMEWTVEHRRKTITARVAARPFFDPERKRSTPPVPVSASAAATIS
ncbi:MAG: aminomethyltransferase [Planctomycetota bacterium]|jgi:aminomethyltransferase